MLFSQDRTKTRELFINAWQKHLTGCELEPLEKQVASLIEEHPEYQSLMQSDKNVLDKDFTGFDGQENPFLHLSLHLALREQVGTDRPKGIASITRSLLLKHQDGHKVEHLMIDKLGLFLWDAQRQNRQPDEYAYLQSLQELL